jgi:hypothetical protein
LNLKPVHPHSYFGLALLYRVTGHPEESLKVLERLFTLMPKTPGIESSPQQAAGYQKLRTTPAVALAYEAFYNLFRFYPGSLHNSLWPLCSHGDQPC